MPFETTHIKSYKTCYILLGFIEFHLDNAVFSFRVCVLLSTYDKLTVAICINLSVSTCDEKKLYRIS